MLRIFKEKKFLYTISKIKDQQTQKRIKNLIKKIIINPKIGKPMQYKRIGTREVYLPPWRLSYAYLKEENKLIFLDLYHKRRQ